MVYRPPPKVRPCPKCGFQAWKDDWGDFYKCKGCGYTFPVDYALKNIHPKKIVKEDDS